MKLLYFFVFAACVFYTTLGYDYDLYDSQEVFEDLRLYSNETEDKNCTKPGLMCKNCNELVNCVRGEGGEFDEQPVQTCSSDESCQVDHCTTAPNPICIVDYKFECTATGMFPDPFDCRKFHFCAAKESSSNDIEIIEGAIGKTTFKCDKTHSYDPITTYCKNNITNGCPDNNYPVPICTKSGQSGALSNKSIYYVCIVADRKLIPKLYLCPHGKTYNNNTCV